eukprot:gene22198-biopygen14746
MRTAPGARKVGPDDTDELRELRTPVWEFMKFMKRDTPPIVNGGGGRARIEADQGITLHPYPEPALRGSSTWAESAVDVAEAPPASAATPHPLVVPKSDLLLLFVVNLSVAKHACPIPTLSQVTQCRPLVRCNVPGFMSPNEGKGACLPAFEGGTVCGREGGSCTILPAGERGESAQQNIQPHDQPHRVLRNASAAPPPAPRSGRRARDCAYLKHRFPTTTVWNNTRGVPAVPSSRVVSVILPRRIPGFDVHGHKFINFSFQPNVSVVTSLLCASAIPPLCGEAFDASTGSPPAKAEVVLEMFTRAPRHHSHLFPSVAWMRPEITLHSTTRRPRTNGDPGLKATQD